MNRDNVNDDAIGQFKMECLKLAASKCDGGEDDIIKAAQKFWDFILKSDETPDEE